jgi:hypothetical protein
MKFTQTPATPVHNFRKMPTTFPTIWKFFSLFFTWIGAIAGFSG